MNIFKKNKNYTLQKIDDICDKNDLIIVDCLKDENMISIEEYNDGELGDCIWEFKRVGNDSFRLVYTDKIYFEFFLQNRKNALIQN